MLITDIDPRVHEIIEAPVVQSYRRETGIENLVGYRHKETGKWVLAMKSYDGRSLWEVGYLDGTEEGDSRDPTKENFTKVVMRLRRGWQTAKQLKGKMRGEAKAHGEMREEEADKLAESMGTFYRHLRNKFGAHMADTWRYRHGMPCSGADIMVGT